MATTEHDAGPLVPAPAFARTYAARVYDDAYQAVEDYRAAMAYHEAHPDRGTRSIAREFDLPTGRVQAWLDGSRPNPVRGLEVAEARGWIDPDPHGDTMAGLNVLVAWTVSRGSITADTWTPLFVVVDAADRAILQAAAASAGVELDYSRAASDDRTQELRPVSGGSVLGRVLHLLGAPRGEMTAADGPAVPTYLDVVPEARTRDFLQVFFHTLGAAHEGRTVIEFGERYPASFIDGLASLVERLTGASASVLGRNVVLSRAASEAVAVWEPLPRE